jgi:exodeoxyribonuclease VII large subunit
VLARGYAIARDGEGHVIGSSDKVDVGEEIEVLLGRGSISATVSGVRE